MKIKSILSSLLLSLLLINQASAASFTWDFSTAGEYTYNTSKIEVTNGMAQLKNTTASAVTDSSNNFNTPSYYSIPYSTYTEMASSYFKLKGTQGTYLAYFDGNDIPSNEGWTRQQNGTLGSTVIETASGGVLEAKETAKYIRYLKSANLGNGPNINSSNGYTIEARALVVTTAATGYTMIYFIPSDSTVGGMLSFYADKVTLNGSTYSMNTTDTYHTYKMVVSGTTLTLYVDGNTAITTTTKAQTLYSEFGKNAVVWGDTTSTYNSDMYWDYLNVWDNTGANPNYSTYPTGTYYATTASGSQLSTSTWLSLNNVTTVQTTPTNTDVKYLVSFDGRSSWKYWNGSAWTATSTSSISSTGMTKSTLEGITQAQWQSTGGFIPGTTTTLDFAIGLTSSNQLVTPTVDTINVAYVKATYNLTNPTIINNTNAPTFTTLNSFSSTLGANNQGTVKYLISGDKTTWYYWNGTAWTTTSQLYVRGNTADEVNAHISSFLPQTGKDKVYFTAFLNTPSNTQQTILDSITVGYDYTPPIVSTVTPTYGPSTGGTSIAITGNNFFSGATVKVGSQTADNIVVIDSSHITATTKAGTGTVNVTVTNANGQTGTLTGGFIYSDPPTYSSITPNNGPASGGTDVTITGTNFQTGTTVKFGSAQATNVQVNSDTQLTVTIPSHDAGYTNITITNPDGQSVTSSSTSFIFNSPPIISQVIPTNGTKEGGTTVKIVGTGFQNNGTVIFGGETFSNLTKYFDESLNKSYYTITSPAHSAGAVDITIQSPDGQSGKLTNGYTYNEPPTISSISPSNGSKQGGTEIEITGSNFISGAKIIIDGTTLNDISVYNNGTSIKGTTLAHTAGTFDVIVKNPDTQIATQTNGFTFNEAPTITDVSPNHGLPSGNYSVTITGNNFMDGAIVKIDGKDVLSTTVLSQTQISVITPSSTEGPANVYIKNPDGQYVNLSNGFLYDYAPTITSISPNNGSMSGGTSVTITGTYFQNGTTVTFDGITANNITYVDDTHITVSTPEHDTGYVKVEVQNPDGQTGSRTNGFYYNSLPQISTITPNNGPLAGGNTVNIYGSGLLANATVLFGSTPATNVTRLNDASLGYYLSATAPSGTAGTVDITVTNPDNQTTTKTDGYTYNNPPTTTQIDPTTGSQYGGTVVTITGSGFLKNATVTIGGVKATINNINNDGSSITAITGQHAPGTVDVVVKNADGQTSTLTAAFTYDDSPAITDISPNHGILAGGTAVTITGSNFKTGAKVKIGGTLSTATNVISNTEIQTTTATHTAGTFDVTVTNTDNQIGTLKKGYTYDAAPEITTVTPKSGPQSGNTLVSILGTNFVSGADVKIDGVSLTNITYIDSTHITGYTTSHTGGIVNVTITNPDTQSNTKINGYTYNLDPEITSITPAYGTSLGGNTIRIYGKNFIETPKVYFDQDQATNVSIQLDNNTGENYLEVTTPAHTIGTVDVKVENPEGTSTTITNGYEYRELPTISTISPDHGTSKGGTTVTITGNYFSAGAKLYFDGSEATSVTVQDSNTITCLTPTHTSAKVTITIKNQDGKTNTSKPIYTFDPYPTINKISPKAGLANKATTITITGTNFVTGATVTVGGTAATNITVVDDKTITADTPELPSGTVAVSVTNPNNDKATLNNSYTYAGVPTITSIYENWDKVAGGKTINIYGQSYVGNPVVNIGNNTCTDLTIVDDTHLTCSVPAGEAGTTDLTITTEAGTSAISTRSKFIYYGQPYVTSINPNQGPNAGGTTVTINGGNFTNKTKVRIGTKQAFIISQTNDTLTIKTPFGTDTKDVIVTNPEEQDDVIPHSTFTYTGSATTSPVPQVDLISPNKGPKQGGTSVTIIGNNFQNGATVTIGGVTCNNPTVVTTSAITCETGSSTTGGWKNVKVTNPDSKFGSLQAGFYYDIPEFFVIPLGDGATDYSLNQGEDQQIIFSEELTDTSKQTIENKITAGANYPITYTWTLEGSSQILTLHGNPTNKVTFYNDVLETATSKVSGETLQYALLIDSALDSYQDSAAPVSRTDNNHTEVVVLTPEDTSVIVPETTINPTINLDPLITVTTGEIAPLNIETETSTGIVRLATPENNVLTASDNWSQIISLPTVISAGSIVNKTEGTITKAYKIGNDNVNLSFSKAVKLTFVGDAGNKVGYQKNDTFTDITTTCTANSQAAGDALPVNGTCKTTEGQDLVVWTKHFTDFIIYNTNETPTITKVTPTSGTINGGTTITITGTNFGTGATVTIGSQTATDITVVSNTQITAKTPANTAGTYDITITNPDNKIATLTNAYTYNTTTNPTQEETQQPTQETSAGSTQQAQVKIECGNSPTIEVINPGVNFDYATAGPKQYTWSADPATQKVNSLIKITDYRGASCSKDLYISVSASDFINSTVATSIPAENNLYVNVTGSVDNNSLTQAGTTTPYGNDTPENIRFYGTSDTHIGNGFTVNSTSAYRTLSQTIRGTDNKNSVLSPNGNLKNDEFTIIHHSHTENSETETFLGEATFGMAYELQIPSGKSAGSYHNTITYSLYYN